MVNARVEITKTEMASPWPTGATEITPTYREKRRSARRAKLSQYFTEEFESVVGLGMPSGFDRLIKRMRSDAPHGATAATS